MTPEARVRDPVVKWARAHSILHIRMHMGRGARVGWPDDLFIKNGIVVAVEFKAPGRTPRRIQEHRIRQLEEHNVAAAWFDNSADAIAFITARLRGARSGV